MDAMEATVRIMESVLAGAKGSGWIDFSDIPLSAGKPAKIKAASDNLGVMYKAIYAAVASPRQ